MNPDRFLARYDAQDRALVAAGFPATSPWWREQLGRFLSSGRRTFVLRVGRRGGKSSTLCRVGVAWAFAGMYRVPPGDVGVIAFVSVSRDESAQRLRTIEAILRALGATFRRSGDAIELDGLPVVFKTFTASVAGVSGFTAILAIADEAAKWQDGDTHTNPASEVLATLRPTMATQPTARLFLCSSPLSDLDAHAKAFDAGDTEAQLVAHAETWKANPSITEAATRVLEPDQRLWLREYAAIPQAALAAAFDAEHVDGAFRAPPKPARWGRPILALDPSSGKGDSFTSALVGWSWPKGPGEPIDFTGTTTTGQDAAELFEHDGFVYRRDENGKPVFKAGCEASDAPQLVVWALGALDGRWFGRVPMTRVVADLAERAHRAGVRVIASDQREDASLEAMFRGHGLRFQPYAWTNESKSAAVMRLRRLLADRQVVLPEGDDALRRELLGFSEKVLPSGAISYGARSAGRDDRVAAILTALMADLDGEIELSPFRRAHGRNQVTIEDRLLGLA